MPTLKGFWLKPTHSVSECGIAFGVVVTDSKGIQSVYELRLKAKGGGFKGNQANSGKVAKRNPTCLKPLRSKYRSKRYVYPR